MPIFDIEDLVKAGKRIKGCPYYASRVMAIDAEIIFCPYTYLLDPGIRESLNIDLRGNIVILDEAHNAEDVCREAGSLHLQEDFLLRKFFSAN